MAVQGSISRTPTKTTSAVKSPPVPESYKDKDVKKETKENTEKKNKDVAKATEEKKDKEKKGDKKRSKEKADEKDKKPEKKEQPDSFDTMLEGISGMDSDSEKSHCSSTTLELGKPEEVGGDDGCDDEESGSEEHAEEQESSSEMEEDGPTESSEEEAEPEAPKKKRRRKWKHQMRMKGKLRTMVQKGKQFLMLPSVLKKVQPGPIRCLIKGSGVPFLDNAMTEKIPSCSCRVCKHSEDGLVPAVAWEQPKPSWA